MRKVLLALLGLVLLAAGGAAIYWQRTGTMMQAAGPHRQPIDLVVKPGATVRAVLTELDGKGALADRRGVDLRLRVLGSPQIKSGRYEINTHSGTVRLLLANPGGFELNANSFSGSIRSELPLTIGGDSGRRDDSPRSRRDAVNNHSMRATFGDGSATLVVRTFSGDIIIAKR